MPVCAQEPVAAEQLKTAFEVFNRHSSELARSYEALTTRVAQLTAELRDERSARLEELLAKERLHGRLALLLETLPGGILVIDGDGVIRERNTEAAALLHEPLEGCAWAEIVQREARTGGLQDGNIQLQDGRWLSLSRRPLTNEPGEILLLADVTDSRHMSELRQRQERLTAIGEMTAEFAHQVRTPLASALLYASRLAPSGESDRRISAKLIERLHDLGRMVDDMLGFAVGGKRVDERVDVEQLFASIGATVDTLLHYDTTLEMLIDGSDLSHRREDCGPFRFWGNGEALKGALSNLIVNADQAATGPMRIQLGAWRDDECVCFTVTDDGPGIAPEILARVFEPFFTTRPQGTGLGLAVVDAVVKAHDGNLSVRNLDPGTQFILRLPIAESMAAGASGALDD